MTRSWPLIPLVLLTAVGFCGMHRTFPWPYPSFDRLELQRHGLQDVTLATAGFRSLAADLAWVQLLQYVGGGFLPGENTSKSYAELKPLTLRVTRLDPYFRHAYLYSASMLAFFRNIDRPSEALDVLVEGMRANPTFWPLRATAVAIGYMKRDEFERTAKTLEGVIQEPGCPAVVKAVLANAYTLHGRKADAARIWAILLADPNAEEYHQKARRELARDAAHP